MADYVYKASDGELKGFADNFASRVGDNSGPHDQDYFDMVKLLLSIKREGSLLDIGAGLGRVTKIAKDIIAETIALEPDQQRWQECHAACHQPPQCRVLRQLTSEYIADNPGKTFDVIVIGMVIQHISTTACQALFEEAASLLKPDGVGIIFTSHTVEQARGFSYSGAAPDEVYLSQRQFNDYAENCQDQTKGIPVRRFSKAELLDCLKPYFETLYWRQVSYYREDRAAHFENRLRLEPGTLKDTGISQFVVVQKAARGRRSADVPVR